MPKPIHCVVEGCANTSHAKGYCRRHYGQIWRRGMIYNNTPRQNTNAPESEMRRDDRIKSLERELRKAQQMYDVVVGYRGRIKWRRELEAVQDEIRKLTETETDFQDIHFSATPPSNESGVSAAITNGQSKPLAQKRNY